MAHKTNSKEQFKFNLWYYKISFKNKIKPAIYNIYNEFDYNYLENKRSSNFFVNNNSIYKNFLFIYYTKKNLTYFETNLFFLRSYLFLIKFHDINFFNFNYFK